MRVNHWPWFHPYNCTSIFIQVLDRQVHVGYFLRLEFPLLVFCWPFNAGVVNQPSTVTQPMLSSKEEWGLTAIVPQCHNKTMPFHESRYTKSTLPIGYSTASLPHSMSLFWPFSVTNIQFVFMQRHACIILL